MRSRTDIPSPITTRPEPAKRRTRATRAVGGTRRRAPSPPDATLSAASSHGPISLYRAEKARRASNVDATVMAEAKKAYDALVAEQGAKRAGMRSSVVSVARRGRTPAPKG